MLRKSLLAAVLATAAFAAPAAASEQIVQLRSGAAVPAPVAAAQVRALPLIDAVVADLGPAQVAALRRDPAVRAITPNRSVAASVAGPDAGLETAYNASIRSTIAWNHGLTGAGVGVAVLDTGIQGDVADFGGRVVASAVVNADATTAGDRDGHGTHVAGLIAGDDARHRGVAPGADLVSVKVSDDSGDTSLADVIAGLQFVVDHRHELGIRVVNLSLNSSVAGPASTDPLNAAVEAAWFSGLVVVAAAGNRGAAAGAVDYAPASDPYAITVGAVDDQGTARTNDDVLAPWSRRGETTEGLTKPDVLAPGARMVSTLSPGSEFASLCPSCIRDGRWFQVGGTSMAAGVVSGAVALLLEAHPDWTPDRVKGALVGTLRNGVIDVPAAVRAKPGLVANRDATPSALFETTGGDVDWSRISWSRISWSRAQGDLAAGWSRISWSCDCPAAPAGDGDAVDPSRISWSRISWSRISWSRISWSRISWSSSFDK